MNEKIEHFLSTLGRSVNTIKTYRQALIRYEEIAGDELSNDAYEKFLCQIKKIKNTSTKNVMRTAVMRLYAFYEVPGESRRKNLNDHYLEKQKSQPVNFNREAIEKLIAHVERMPLKNLDDWRDRAFVLLAVDGGFRISELCQIKRSSIDWLNRQVHIVGKGDKPAFVRLSKRSSEAFSSYLSYREDNVVFLTPDGMRKSIKQRMIEAGIPKGTIRIHDFRHYFVTVTLIATGNIKVAKEFARHENIKTTDRYSHMATPELDKIYDDVFNKGESNETNRTYP